MNVIRPSCFRTLRSASLVLALAIGFHAGSAWSQTISTVAGNGNQDFTGDTGPATAAALKGPHGMVFDQNGNMYIADRNNSRVRRVDAITGVITTVAGSGILGTTTGDGGPATAATLYNPEALAVDASNLYIADPANNRVRRVNLSSGIITTYAGSGIFGAPLGDGGPATAANLSQPTGLALDSSGNLYISDWGNFRIRKVNAGGVITTVAGDGRSGFFGDGGPATAAGLNAAEGIALDAAGNLYIADTGHSRIRMVSAGSGIINTIAGNGNREFTGDGGPATSASLFDPGNVIVDGSGTIFISDTANNRIRKVSGGVITTYAGNGGFDYDGDGVAATSAALGSPRGLALDASGNLYIADFANNRVRKVAQFTAQTITFAPVLPAVRLPGDTVAVSATASSGLPVTIISTTPSVCTIAGSTVTMVAAGACALAADQAGNATFAPAPRVTQSIPVGIPGTIPQSITFVPFATRTYLPGEGVTLQASASSGLAVTFSSSTAATCTVAGTKATLVAPGTCTIAADQLGDANYVAAPQVTQSLVVSAAPIAGTFAFLDQGNVLAGRFITSNSVQIAGIPAPVAVTVTGGSYSIGCSGTFTTAAGTMSDGQTVCVRHNSSLNPGVTTDTVLTVGAVSDTFSSTTASSNAAGLIAGYYRSILRREADSGGLAYWEGEAARMFALGANVNETWRAMSIAFFTGPEYLALNRTDTEFVVDMYNTFFNRPPELDGLSYWTGQILSGIPRRVVILSFLFSGEFTNYMQGIFGAVPSRPEEDMVIDFYRGFLDRLPDSAGYASWVTRFRAAQCTSRQAVQVEADAISRDFLNGAEYLARSRSNQNYVSDLYNAFMRRGADLAGVSYWDNQLNTLAQTREQLRQIFLSSPEFQERLKRVADRGCT